MQIITVLAQAMDAVRRKFLRGEQLMLIDIFNSTMLNPGVLGRHIVVQVEDSFALYPGTYEEKWPVDKKTMRDKVAALTASESALLEMWAVGFWALNGENAIEDYVAGSLNILTRMEEMLDLLKNASVKLEATKTAFKSASIAEARKLVEDAAEGLQELI